MENVRTQDIWPAGKITTSIELCRGYKNRTNKKGSEFFRAIFEPIGN